MKQLYLRIMIINWKWGKYFTIPRYSLQKKEDWDQFLQDMNQSLALLPVVSPVPNTEILPELEPESVKDWIVPICVEFETDDSDFYQKKALVATLMAAIQEKLTPGASTFLSVYAA